MLKDISSVQIYFDDLVINAKNEFHYDNIL